MYFVHICYSAIIISLRKIKMHVCRKEEFSYKGLEHKLTLPREKKLFIFFNSIYMWCVLGAINTAHKHVYCYRLCLYFI